MKTLRYQVPAIFWAVVIFAASSLPGTSPLLRFFFGHDKIVHTVVYFCLAFLTFRALYYQSRFPVPARYALLISVVLSLVYGAADELHQLFVPNRSADIRDFLADAAGALVCLLLLSIAQLIRRRREPRSTGAG
jgi:VanZ family protein